MNFNQLEIKHWIFWTPLFHMQPPLWPIPLRTLSLTGRFNVGHIFHLRFLLFFICSIVVIQHVQHGLGILLLLHLGDVGLRQKLGPWLGHPLQKKKRWRRISDGKGALKKTLKNGIPFMLSTVLGQMGHRYWKIL